MITDQMAKEINEDIQFKLSLTHEDVEAFGCKCPTCQIRPTEGSWWIEMIPGLGAQIICEACTIQRERDYRDEATWIKVPTKAQRADARQREYGIN